MGRESACSAGDQGSIARLGKSPGEGKVKPLHCLEIPWAEELVGYSPCGSKSQIQLSNYTTTTRGDGISGDFFKIWFSMLIGI